MHCMRPLWFRQTTKGLQKQWSFFLKTWKVLIGVEWVFDIYILLCSVILVKILCQLRPVQASSVPAIRIREIITRHPKVLTHLQKFWIKAFWFLRRLRPQCLSSRVSKDQFRFHFRLYRMFSGLRPAQKIRLVNTRPSYNLAVINYNTKSTWNF